MMASRRGQPQLELPFAEGEAAVATRRDELWMAAVHLGRLLDAPMHIFLDLVYRFGGTEGRKLKRSFSALASRGQYGLCCSVDKAQAVVETAERFGLVAVTRGRNLKGERQENEYAIDWVGVARLRKTGRPEAREDDRRLRLGQSCDYEESRQGQSCDGSKTPRLGQSFDEGSPNAAWRHTSTAWRHTSTAGQHTSTARQHYIKGINSSFYSSYLNSGTGPETGPQQGFLSERETDEHDRDGRATKTAKDTTGTVVRLMRTTAGTAVRPWEPPEGGTTGRATLAEALCRQSPELAEGRQRHLAPLPASSLLNGVFGPLQERHLREPWRLVEWHRRQLSTVAPVMGDSEADLLLTIATALYTCSVPAREVRSNRVAIFVRSIHARKWCRALSHISKARMLLDTWIAERGAEWAGLYSDAAAAEPFTKE